MRAANRSWNTYWQYFFFTLGNYYTDICFNILSYTFISGVIFCKCVALNNEKLNIGITYLKLQAYEIQIQHSSLLNRTEIQCKYKIDQVHNIIIFFIPFLYNDLFQNLVCKLPKIKLFTLVKSCLYFQSLHDLAMN